MELHEVIVNSQVTLGKAIVAEQNSDLVEAHSQMEKLHDLQHELTLARTAAEPAKPESEIDTVDLPTEQPAEQPEIKQESETKITGFDDKRPGQKVKVEESKDGAGVVSEPAEQESKPGAGVVSEPEKSQNKDGSGIA